jgi:hypothetical protein
VGGLAGGGHAGAHRLLRPSQIAEKVPERSNGRSRKPATAVLPCPLVSQNVLCLNRLTARVLPSQLASFRDVLARLGPNLGPSTSSGARGGKASWSSFVPLSFYRSGLECDGGRPALCRYVSSSELFCSFWPSAAVRPHSLLSSVVAKLDSKRFFRCSRAETWARHSAAQGLGSQCGGIAETKILSQKHSISQKGLIK